MNFSFLTKLISAKEFANVLKNRVITAFKGSFEETNKILGIISKPKPEAIQYLVDRQLILSQKTLDRLHGNLKMELLEGLNNKESITEIKQRIEPLFDKMKDFEIERLVRTEVLLAENGGEFNSQIDAGVAKYKVWKAAINNSRTASDSKRLHNQIVEIDKPFTDPETGDECMYSPNRPNCRCSIHYLEELPKKTTKKGRLLYLVD